MFFAEKRPSIDESPLQDLSADQLSQVSGGTGSFLKREIKKQVETDIKIGIIQALLHALKKHYQ